MYDDLFGIVIVLFVLALLAAMIILPIISLVVSIRTRIKLKQTMSRLESLQPPAAGSPSKLLVDAVQQLTVRVARLEAAMKIAPPGAPPTPADQPPRDAAVPPPAATPPPFVTPGFQAPRSDAAPPPPYLPPPAPARTIHAADVESIIGRRWLGWAAVLLILFATAFFLKYAFDNRWIGELGRVAIGVGAGITLTALGFRYHKRGWRVFSQILTGGGIVLLYLSAYASFGFYHLAPQKAAFVYMTILIAEAAALALLYNAPAIAVMALLGGFLVPVLLHSDRDQYRALFGYIFALDIAALVFFKRWWGLRSIAFAGTNLLFWLWYVESYHPRKLGAVMMFQTAVFLAFLLAHVVRRVFKKEEVQFDDLTEFANDPLKFITSLENCSILLVSPFIFFATAYHLLNPNYHDWMGTLAVGMALVYAGTAKLLRDRKATTQTEFLLMVGVALAFITLAIPIQFKTNWITITWAIEGIVILWAGIEIRSARLRAAAHGVFALALLKLVFWDTPYGYRARFTPVVNKYFLSSLFVTACLFAGAIVYKKLGARKQTAARVFQLVLLMVGIVTLWFIMSVETQTFFSARAARLKAAEDISHQRWLGQMVLSVLWSTYAAVLMAIGFLRRTAAIRWAGLSLFALTVIKVMLVDIAVLRQLYRIIAFLVLGLLLLIVAWGYHKAFHSKESST